MLCLDELKLDNSVLGYLAEASLVFINKSN